MPALPLLLAAAAGVLALVVSSGSGRKAVPPEETKDLPQPVSAAGLELVRQYAITVGAPKPWQDFFVLVAKRESNGKSNVGLGTTLNAPPWVEMNKSSSEATAARRAYAQHQSTFGKCWSAGAYGFGSGGFFGMLPAYGLIAFEGTELVCLHPWSVFDPTIAMIMAAHFAHRLTRWSSWQGTVLSTRVGWGDPSSMGSASKLAARRSVYRQDAIAAGLDPAFIDSKLPRWDPLPAATLFDALGGNRGWLP